MCDMGLPCGKPSCPFVASWTASQKPVFKNRQPRHNIFSSDGTSLHLDDDLKRLYDIQMRRVEDMIYAGQRMRYGIWASNQNKFVNRPSELNSWDDKHMEERHALYLRNATT